MDPALIAMGVIALAELGDKTQLVALVLTQRLGRPVVVAGAMIMAMSLMHGLAAFVGAAIDQLMPDFAETWLVGIGFVIMGLWMLRSPGQSGDEVHRIPGKGSAFVTALLVFCFLEFGDKSQLATVGLSIGLESTWQVWLGAAVGAMAVNLPIIWAGHKLQRFIPDGLCKWMATGMFVLLGGWFLAGLIIG